jgi:hypothetical protein
MTPPVSVVIPVFNMARWVGDAIESALAQTVPAGDVEVIVVDDGSTDESAAVARRYAPRVRLVQQPNRGLPAARNAGVRASRGRFLCFLDADDRILPEKTAVQLACFAARPDVGLVYGGWRYVDEAGRPLPERGWSPHEGDVLEPLLVGNLICVHAALVRREPVERAGGFDESLTAVEDWDLWLRTAREGLRWAVVDEVVAEYRMRADAMHQDPDRMSSNTLRVLDKFFADPALPARVVGMRALAYQHAYLVAAADRYRAGDRTAAERWFGRAIEVRPAALTEPRTLLRFCRLLLPPESQSRAAMRAEWRGLVRTLRAATASVFAAPDVAPDVARLRGAARIAYWRAVGRLALRRSSGAR